MACDIVGPCDRLSANAYAPVMGNWERRTAIDFPFPICTFIRIVNGSIGITLLSGTQHGMNFISSNKCSLGSFHRPTNKTDMTVGSN